MEKIMIGISDNWIWLGPLLCLCFGWIAVEVATDMFKGFGRELKDATEEWLRLRQSLGTTEPQMSESQKMNIER